MVDGDLTVIGGYAACSTLLAHNPPTAIVAGNDLTAIGVMHRLWDSGRQIPRDVSVVGFDDILFAEYTQPALTTVAVPRKEIGILAFQALWAMIHDPEQKGRDYHVGTHLVERRSTMPPSPAHTSAR